MNELVVDTSVWVDALKGVEILPLISGLKEGRIVLPPLVLAELLSGVKNEKAEKNLAKFLSYIPLHPVGRAHWIRVGQLRNSLQKKGVATSIPDAHIAQCTLECEGTLLTRDKIFKKMATFTHLKVL